MTECRGALVCYLIIMSLSRELQSLSVYAEWRWRGLCSKVAALGQTEEWEPCRPGRQWAQANGLFSNPWLAGVGRGHRSKSKAVRHISLSFFQCPSIPDNSQPSTKTQPPSNEMSLPVKVRQRLLHRKRSVLNLRLMLSSIFNPSVMTVLTSSSALMCQSKAPLQAFTPPPPHLHLEPVVDTLIRLRQTNAHCSANVSLSLSLSLSLLSLLRFVSTAPWAKPRPDWARSAGSDERAECFCTGRPVGQAPVGAHQCEVGKKRKWRGWDGGERSGSGLRVVTMEIFLGGRGTSGRVERGRMIGRSLELKQLKLLLPRSSCNWPLLSFLFLNHYTLPQSYPPVLFPQPVPSNAGIQALHVYLQVQLNTVNFFDCIVSYCQIWIGVL